MALIPSCSPVVKVRSPISMKWIIPEKRLLALKNSSKACNSNTFVAAEFPHVKYYLAIFPNGTRSDQQGKSWIYLYADAGKGKRIEAEFVLSIEAAQYSHTFKRSFEHENQGWGISCGSTTDLFDHSKKFIVNGEMTLKCDGILVTERPLAALEPHPPEVVSNLGYDLWIKEDDKNISVAVGDKIIKAHQCVLAACSPVLNRALRDAYNDKLHIDGYPFEVVEAAVKSCYHPSLQPYLELENKTMLLDFFNKYQMQKLKDHLEAILVKEISVSNVCHLANCSIKTSAAVLENACADFLIDCIKKNPVCDLETLDKDFGLKILTSAFCNISKTL